MKIPKGMEPVVFSYAYYKVKDFGKAVAFLKVGERGNLFSIDECDTKRQILRGTFIRRYPKGHWSHFANDPTVMQVVGGAEIKNAVLKIDAKTKGGLAELRAILEEHIKDVIEFEREEFQDIMEMLDK